MIFRTNKILIKIFVLSLIVYLLSCFGAFDWLSAIVAKSLYNSLGYTNKWSHSYGPSWLVGTMGDISSLGSREIVLLFTVFLYFYLKLSRSKNSANNFLFTVGFGIVLILIVKATTSKQDALTFHSVLVESLSNFPSGHTFISTVMYLSAARYLSSKTKNDVANKYLFISASVIIALIGISRFMGNSHTVTEVIAGWSLGLCWYSFAQLYLTSHNLITAKE